MQGKNPLRPSHAELVAEANRIGREATGLGAIFAKAAADRMGVGHSDFECIDIIAQRGRVTAGELAAASGLTTGAVTGVIDRLEAAGIARRDRDAADRRKVYVTILPKALAAGNAHYGSFEKATNALLASYSDAELTLLIDYFTRGRDLMRAAVERLKAEPAAPRSPRRGAAVAPSPSRPPPRR